MLRCFSFDTRKNESNRSRGFQFGKVYVMKKKEMKKRPMDLIFELFD